MFRLRMMPMPLCDESSGVDEEGLVNDNWL